MKPAVLTIAPDNIATVGLIAVVGYLVVVALFQLADRAGLITLKAPPRTAGAGQVVL